MKPHSFSLRISPFGAAMTISNVASISIMGLSRARRHRYQTGRRVRRPPGHQSRHRRRQPIAGTPAASFTCFKQRAHPCGAAACTAHESEPGGSDREHDAVAKVLIIGASRGIGLEIVKAALDARHSVRALARSARRISIDDPKLEKRLATRLR
jgi:hypothetical protein